MRTRFLSIGLLTLALVAGASLVGMDAATSATARPVVTARITAVDAAPGSTAVHITIKAMCPAGWDNNVYAQDVNIREDVNGVPVIAYRNFTGAEVGWACDGQEHVLNFDLTADGPWQAGGGRANFDATVTNGTNSAADFASKNFRVR